MRWIVVTVLILVLGFVSLLGAFSIYPQWFLAQVDDYLPEVSIHQEHLEIGWFPFEVRADELRIDMSSVSIVSIAPVVQVFAWDSVQSKPFWSVVAQAVHINLREVVEQPVEVPTQALTESGSTTGLPSLDVLYSIKTLSLQELTLQSEGVPKEAGYTISDLNISNDGEQFLFKGSMLSADIELDAILTLTRLAEEIPTTQVALVGDFTARLPSAEHNFVIQSGGVTWQPEGGRLALAEIEGVHTYGDPTVNTHTEKYKIDVEITQLTEMPKVAAAIGYGFSQVNFIGGYQSPELAWLGEASIVSSALPIDLPYAEQEIYPFKMEFGFHVAADKIVVQNLSFVAPEIVLGGDLSVSSGDDAGPEYTVRGEIFAKKMLIPGSPSDEDTVLGNTSAGIQGSAEEDSATEDPAIEEVQTQTAEGPLFSETPLDWQWLRSLNVDLSLGIEALDLRQVRLSDVTLGLTAKDGSLQLAPLSGRAQEGAFDASISLALRADHGIDATAKMEVRDMRLDALDFSAAGELSGGALQADIDLQTTGASPLALARGLDGAISLRMDELTVMNNALDILGSDVLSQMLNKLNPFREQDPSTVVQCVAVNLSIEAGELKTPERIVVETDKMRIEGDLDVSLSTETLDITFRPQAKSGLGVGIGDLVKFVKLGGTIRHPGIEIDALGLVHSGATVGAALSTGGISLLAQGLLTRALGDSGCAQEATVLPSAQEMPASQGLEIPGSPRVEPSQL